MRKEFIKCICIWNKDDFYLPAQNKIQRNKSQCKCVNKSYKEDFFLLI